MSNSGKKTPLGLNAEAQLTVNKGLRLNPVAVGYQGIWNAATPYITPVGSGYSQGTVSGTTVLERLTAALPNFYNNASNNSSLTLTGISIPVWRNLIKIGRPIDSRVNNNRINCPGLGNSRPEAFKPSYAGYGTFKTGKLTDKFYNMTSGSLGLVESVYPPYNYPTEGTYSYIYNNWSSLVSTPGTPNNDSQTSFTPYQYQYQYYNDYAWITGWPGVNSWQNKTSSDPQQAYDPVGDEDSYAAAYFPRPDLAAVQPWRTRDLNKIEYDEYFRFGFIATVARQAYYEFWSDYKTRRSNQYIEFCKSFQQHSQFQTQANQKIASFENTKTFVKGNYSNINDLTTSDLAGVSLAFKIFGNDMINLGKSLDLSQIHLFGIPSKFLLNLQKYNALTDALKFALIYADLTTDDLNDILLPTFTPSQTQEKKIFNAFTLVQGQDLSDICIIVNCTTTGLSSLADLINPMKMFPNSYTTLTVPKYNTETLSSKNYDFIYLGNNVNSRIDNWGDYLEGILSEDLAKSCGAFMCTMNQVKNIRQMEVEKLSQVISNLEVTNKDLPLVNSPDGVPGSVNLANQELNLIALGSGSAGVYRFCDFEGAISGWPYRDFYEPATNLIKQLQTTQLQNVYYKLYQKSLFNNWALIGRGKGHSDPHINTTGIPSYYAYDLFKVQSTSTSVYPCIGTITNIVTINPSGINNYTICVTSAGRSEQDSVLPTNNFYSNYSTGQLIHFSNQFDSSPGNSASAVTYVITQVISANTIKIENTLNLVPRRTLGVSTTPPSWTSFLTPNTRWYTPNGGGIPNIPIGWRYNPCTYNLDTGGFNFVVSSGTLSATRILVPAVPPTPGVPAVPPSPGNPGSPAIPPTPGVPAVTETYSASYIDVTFGNVTNGGDFFEPLPYPGWPGLSPGNGLPGQNVYIFEKEYNGYPGNGVLNGTVQNLTDAANLEILRIQNANPEKVKDLNYYWDKIGNQLFLEQRAIPYSVIKNDSIYQGAGKGDLDSFIRAAEDYAQNTAYCETAPILEAISDTSDIGGQSIVAGAREARNARRLMNTGGEVDNDVPDNLNQQTATAKATIANGSIVSIDLTAPGNGYDPANPPNVTILPQTGVFGVGTNSETATNINPSPGNTFTTPIANNPNIANVQPNWTVDGQPVTSAQPVGPNYVVTAPTKMFEPNTPYTFNSPIQPPGAGGKATAVVNPIPNPSPSLNPGSNIVPGSGPNPLLVPIGLKEITVDDPGTGYEVPPIIIIDPSPSPEKLGNAIVPGSFAGSPYTDQDPVPDNLVSPDDASYTVPEAIEDVTLCNCDCWN